MNKNLIKILFLFLVINQFLFAQVGPIYSRYGIGDQIHSHTARRMGFGDLGSAIIDKDYVDGYNPASWSNLKLTRFGISGKFLGATYSDKNGSVYANNFIFSGFTLGFPIERSLGISMAIGLIPISALKYEIAESGSDSLLGNYDDKYKGSGSLSKIFIGASTELPFKFSLGAMFEYYSGTNDYSTKRNFSNSSSYSSIYYDTRYKYSGLGTTVSLISGNVFEYFNKETSFEFRLSGMMNFVSDLTTDTTLVTGTSIGELTPREGEVITKIPTKYTFGAVFGWDEEYLVLFDYVYQPWNEYTFNNTYEKKFKELIKYSLGFQYKPIVRSIHASSWEQTSLRCGLSFEETQYSFDGINIDAYSVHAGVTFPFSSVNLIDLGIAFGIRGKKENNLVKEQFIKAAITLSLGELWFQREDR